MAGLVTDNDITNSAAVQKWNSTLATEVTTTGGTSIDFTGIPSGVKEIRILFVGISSSGSSNVMVQIGDAGGIEATGYLGGAQNVDAAGALFTTGFGVYESGGAAGVYHGVISLYLEDATNFTWVSSTAGGFSNLAETLVGGGAKTLSAELTQIRVTTVGGSDTFDVNSGLNIQYSF